jgi:rRNA maturation endonuclease Nob1
MTEPKTKCENCGFEDDYSNQPTGICQECGNNKLKQIIQEKLNQRRK